MFAAGETYDVGLLTFDHDGDPDIETHHGWVVMGVDMPLVTFKTSDGIATWNMKSPMIVNATLRT